MGNKILDLIDSAMDETAPFENHPASKLSIENQLNYLNGLALVLGSIDSINEKHCEYIKLLIESFSLDIAVFEDVLVFSKTPDKDGIKSLCKAFYNQAIAQTFIFDSYMLASIDDEIKMNESQVIDKLSDNMGVMRGTKKDIEDLFCHIKNKNWKESALYFDSFLLDVGSFKHLLSYYDVDCDDLLQQTSNLRHKRLKNILASRLISSAATTKPKSSRKSTIKAATKSESINLSHEIVIPMLQAEIDRGLAHIENGLLRIESHELETNRTIFGIADINLENYGICYDKYNLRLSSHEDKIIDDIQILDYINKKYLGGGEVLSGVAANDVTLCQIPFSVQEISYGEESIVCYKLSSRITAKTRYVVLNKELYSYERAYYYNKSTRNVAVYPLGSSKSIYIKKSSSIGVKSLNAYSSVSLASKVATLKKVEIEELGELSRIFTLAKNNMLSKLER